MQKDKEEGRVKHDTAVVWFRSDLRLHDHEALYRAVQNAHKVIPVYVVNAAALQREAYGFRKMGARRWRFICDSLTDLRASLRSLGGDLLIAYGKPEEVIAELCEAHGATLVTMHKEVCKEERDEEEAVGKAIAGLATLKFYWGHTLMHLNDLPFGHESLPDVFTDFRKLVEKSSKVRPCFPVPEKVVLPDGMTFFGDIPSEESIGLQPLPIEPRAAIELKGGEGEAWKRLRHYFHESEQLATYKDTRNGLLGADYSSKLSAWLAHGCISARAVYHEVKTFEREVKKNQSTYWMVFELLWRDYFRFVALKFGDRLFYPGSIRNELPSTRHNETLLEAWTSGDTGIPFVDANMKELHLTGFMSNRGRQNVASFLVKDLRQDWRRGAAWFEQELIDYDVCSNWGNWAYVAGIGNDPREERYFNMLTQADRYDGKGRYVKHWIPELAKLPAEKVHTPWTLPLRELEPLGLRGTVYARPLTVPKAWKL